MDDNRPRAGASASTVPVQQPKPQALPSRSGPSSILVSPRQKGNPILNNVRATAWEYSDIPADYVVGATTCALFLSLKYHRLHPEYIYNRIRDLKGQYSLRILLTMVDIENHEESLKELSKTSLVNNVTVMLCWSAQEAGRYLELFKTFENAAPTSIRAQQAGTYSEKMVEFITVPRSINKTDAVGLVSNFGSIRTAINAGPEEIGLIAGWGDKKVQRWCNAVREPFRVKKAMRRGISDSNPATMSRDIPMAEGETQTPVGADSEDIARQRVDEAVPLAIELERSAPFAAVESDADRQPDHRPAEHLPAEHLNQDAEEAMREAEMGRATIAHHAQSTAPRPAKRKQAEEDMSEGVMAALSRLRKHYLQAVHVKAARAVSRKFRDNATPALFRSIVACARYKALGAFQNVSLHSIYPSYVKEIVFDGSVYDARLAEQDNVYYFAQKQFSELDFGSHWARRTRWKRYQALYQEQEDMKGTGVLLQSLARGLENMPNVSSIVYSPRQHYIPTERDVVRDVIPRGGLPSAPGVGTYRSTNRYTSPDHPFRQLIGAISLSRFTGVREFTVERRKEGEPSNEFSLGIFEFPEKNDLQAGKFMFQHLVKLELNLTISDCPRSFSGPNPGGVEQLANLAKLLVAAQDLRHLALHISGWAFSHGFMYGHVVHDDQPVFRYLGLGATWPKLRSMSLEGITADEQDFTNLIQRHKDTLRSLVVRKSNLCTGVWAEVVDEVVFNASMVVAFTLDLVNEADENARRRVHEERESWRYEGHLVVAEDGDRNFVNPNPEKKSVYVLRR
ncbi:hypothetical protein EJ02DRAFT_500233 [Clathrospora elynae]|uniref:ERCC1-like central domain-containing protein n=1 Tax=Clathrospora elynae TaxID=706981 RepID=A0A6A5SZI4_9PLEO|nr:hypothetical protein EJ02DRAFT_500233 [Clathrospora elynae]